VAADLPPPWAWNWLSEHPVAGGQEDRQPVPNRLLEEIRMAARLRRTLDEVIRSLPAREEHGAAGYPADVVMTR